MAVRKHILTHPEARREKPFFGARGLRRRRASSASGVAQVTGKQAGCMWGRSCTAQAAARPGSARNRRWRAAGQAAAPHGPRARRRRALPRAARQRARGSPAQLGRPVAAGIGGWSPRRHPCSAAAPPARVRSSVWQNLSAGSRPSQKKAQAGRGRTRFCKKNKGPVAETQHENYQTVTANFFLLQKRSNGPVVTLISVW